MALYNNEFKKGDTKKKTKHRSYNFVRETYRKN